MEVYINIEEDLISQFSKQLDKSVENEAIVIDSNIGIGTVNCFNLPNTLKVYHFNIKLRQAIKMQSSNPINSDYILLNINLSDTKITKTINGKEISFQKLLPSGILLYPPQIEVQSLSPENTKINIILIKFNRDLLDQYFEQDDHPLNDLKGTIIYEDLDNHSEKILNNFLKCVRKLDKHSLMLSFLSRFFNKISERKVSRNNEKLHPEDVKHLFMAAATLRDPLSLTQLSLEDLARLANMGKTKFKNSFKQVFGKAPFQYRTQIRMEYAKSILQNKAQSPTELAFDLGYADPSKFSRAFKNYFGYTPTSVIENDR